MLAATLDSSPCSPDTTIFMPPAVVQTICVSVGFTMGDAMATPMKKANHTNTSRAND